MRSTILLLLTTGLLVLVGIACPGNARPDKPEPVRGPAELPVGVAGNFTAHGNDPDGQDVRMRFDWDDGDTSEWTSFAANGETVQASHRWSLPDTYYVSAQAEDRRGARSLWSDWLRVVVVDTVNRAPGVPSVLLSDSSPVRQLVDVTARAFDPDGDRLYYVVFFGNGDSSVSALIASGTEVLFRYAWRDTGSYLVQALARDEHGAESGLSPGHTIRVFQP